MEREPDFTASESSGADHLLEQGPFLRRVARRLVRNHEEADDLVQETWVASLQNPPAGGGSELRPWLARVARNLAVSRFRRRARVSVPVGESSDGARDEPSSPGAAEIVAGRSVQEDLLVALRNLPDAYRAPIVMHFYDGLPPRRIAKALGLPVETVRTRIKRGLARLRADMDRRWPRSRGDWVGALLAWVPTARGRPRDVRLRTSATAWGVGVLAFGTVAWLSLERASLLEGAPLPAQPEAVAAASGGATGVAGAGDEASARTALLPERATLAIRVVVAEDGAPVQGAELLLRQGEQEHRLRTDEGGRCAGLLDPSRPAAIDVGRTAVSAPRHEEWRPEGARAPSELVIRVARGSSLDGRLSDALGNPVRAGEVLVYEGSEPVVTADGWPAPTLTVPANDDGTFAVSGLDRRFFCLARAGAWVSQGALRAELARAEELRGVEFVLAPGHALAGTVRDEDGVAVAGATVAVQGGSDRRTSVRNTTSRGALWVDQIAATTTTDARGRFRVGGLVRKVAGLTVRHPEYPPVDQVLAPAADALDSFVEVTLTRAVALELLVHDSTGAPAAGAAVRCLAERGTMTALETQRYATDSNGRCRIAGLAPGARFTVRVDPRAGPPMLHASSAAAPGGTLALCTPPARDLRGTVRALDGTPAPACRIELHWAGLTTRDPLVRRELSRLAVLVTGADGSFSIPALPDVELVAEVSSPSTSSAGVHRIPAGVTVVELGPGDRDWRLAGRISDASTGRSLGVRERALLHAFERGGERRTAAVEVRDGAYRLSLPGSGQWWICAQADGYATRVVAREPGPASTLDVALFPERRLEVFVEDRNGRPWKEGSLAIDDEDGQRWQAWKRPGLTKNSFLLGPRGEAVLDGLPAKPVRLTFHPGGLRTPLRRIVDLTDPCAPLTWRVPLDGAAPGSAARLELKRVNGTGTPAWYEGTAEVVVLDAHDEAVLSWSFSARDGVCDLRSAQEGLSVDYDEAGRITHVRERTSAHGWAPLSSAGADATRVPGFDFALAPGTYRVVVSGQGFDGSPRVFAHPGESARAEPWVLWAEAAALDAR